MNQRYLVFLIQKKSSIENSNNTRNNSNAFRNGLTFNNETTRIVSAQPVNNRMQNICNKSFTCASSINNNSKKDKKNLDDTLFNNSSKKPKRNEMQSIELIVIMHPIFIN